MVLTLKFSKKDGSYAFTTEVLSSPNFSLLFQDHQFPALTCFSGLDETDSSDDLYDSGTDIGNMINNTNGSTVTRWYKKGVVNDQSDQPNNGRNESITAGTVTIHSVHIVPNDIEEDEIGFINDKEFKDAPMYISE